MTTTFDSSTSVPSFRRLGVGLVLFLLVFQIWARYVPHPTAVFVVDDWTNWSRSQFYSSASEAFKAGLQDAKRPISMAAVESVFHLAGNRMAFWTGLSIMANTALLFFVLMMVWRLTDSAIAVLGGGVLLSVLPNLTETFHWSTQVLNEVSCALVFYAASGWLWIEFVRRGGMVWLIGSVVAFGIGLFSYEAGALLPASYLLLLPWKKPVRDVLIMSAFGGVLLFYAAWRLTNSFGMNELWVYPVHMDAGLSLTTIWWNARQLVHWWVGDHFWGTALSGWSSFSTLQGGVRRSLFVLNAGLATMVLWWAKHLLREKTSGASPHFSPAKILGFGLVWLTAAAMIPLISYTASRLMVLPAIGVALLFGFLLSTVPFVQMRAFWFFPLLGFLCATQGISESYRQAGELNQRLHQHLTETLADWSEKELILIDSVSVRHRLTPGLLRPTGRHPETWSTFNRALLIRGISLRGMIHQITGTFTPPQTIILDVEHHASWEGEDMVWTDRFDSETANRTPSATVYRVDLGDLLWP
ncbi:MAG TPA: hypothetical protein PKE55_06220 [Kiritimatiellia bacterium]|nr:hypothetical protein [Kiritimatiellia bacterium]